MNSYTNIGIRLAALLTSTLAFGGLFIAAPMAHAAYGANPAPIGVGAACDSRYDPSCIVKEWNYLYYTAPVSNYNYGYNNYYNGYQPQAYTYGYNTPSYQYSYQYQYQYQQPASSYYEAPEYNYNYNGTPVYPSYQPYNYTEPDQYASNYSNDCYSYNCSY
jgi:hypothetical protein